MSLTSMRFILVISSLLFMSACAQTPYHVPISSNVHKNIRNTSVKMGLNQEEIYMKFRQADSSSATSQYGFLGALFGSLIDSAINSSESEDAEKLVKPVKNALININFEKEMTSALNSKLRTLKWLRADNTSVISSYNDDMTSEIIEKSKSSAVLMIRPDYYISTDARSFKIDTTVILYPSNSKLKNISKIERPDEEDKIIYRNLFHFTYNLPNEKKLTGDKEAVIKNWSKNNGKYIKLAIRTGILQTTKMVALDLSKVVQSKNITKLAEAEKKREILKSGKNYELARSPNGALFLLYN